MIAKLFKNQFLIRNIVDRRLFNVLSHYSVFKKITFTIFILIIKKI